MLEDQGLVGVVVVSSTSLEIGNFSNSDLEAPGRQISMVSNFSLWSYKREEL